MHSHFQLIQTKVKSPMKKAASVSSLPAEQVNDMAVSISTISKVVIDIVPDDNRQPRDKHLIPQSENGCISRDVPCKVTLNRPQGQDYQAKLQISSKMENNISSVSLEDEEDTMKLLQQATKGDGKMPQVAHTIAFIFFNLICVYLNN